MLELRVIESALSRAWRRDSVWHGETHWRCVAATGLDLVAAQGGDREIVVLFGLLHDTRRENESIDPDHGIRAAAYTLELAGAGAIDLDAPRLEILCHAIAEHADGGVSDEPTVGACWDADRLHLPRVSIDPDPALFSTAGAHGPQPLAASARLRAQPPTWAEILASLDA